MKIRFSSFHIYDKYFTYQIFIYLPRHDFISLIPSIMEN